MQFKDIKQNFPIYILDTSSVELIKGKVTGTTFPRADMSQPFGQQNQRMVIDLTIEANGHSATYTVSDSASVNYAGNLILATEQQLLSSEVEAIKNTAEQALAPERVEQLKQQLTKATTLLAELNPSFKQQQENDQRFTKLESAVTEMKDMFANFLKEFKS